MTDLTDLTEPQIWAMFCIDAGRADSPAQLGQAMMDRPGAMPEWRKGTSYAAQSYGRMGGPMMERLRKAGLVQLTYSTFGFWHATKAKLTRYGEEILRDIPMPEAFQP